MSTHQTADEYMELYKHMQESAAADTSATTAADCAASSTAAAASTTTSQPTTTAPSAPSKPIDLEDDDDEDVTGTNSRFQFPNLSCSPSLLSQFSLTKWVPLLKKHTIPTRFIPLSKDFVEYLEEEGVWIPEQYAPVRSDDFHDRDEALSSSDDDDDEHDDDFKEERARAKIEEIDSSDEEEERVEAERAARVALRSSQPFFPELVASLTSHLDALGGAVFPSLDFHAPTDASWIMTERVTKCQTIGEILLLLKSSDKVQDELSHPFQGCSEQSESSTSSAAATSSNSSSSSSSSTAFAPTLALRKWSSLHPSKLFRCFVYRGTLLAISQLDPNFYDFLQKPELHEQIQDSIEEWLEDNDICETLSENLGITNCIMDVYIDLQERVWLVRLKPFWPKFTRACLFSWKEIYELSVKFDKEQEEKKAKSAEIRKKLAEGFKFTEQTNLETAANSDAPLGGWPSDADLLVPFRVIPSAAAGMDILNTVNTMASRFPVDGHDVSDQAAIDRWIHRVENGDLKQTKK